jgi:hypothetical protein
VKHIIIFITILISLVSGFSSRGPVIFRVTGHTADGVTVAFYMEVPRSQNLRPIIFLMKRVMQVHTAEALTRDSGLVMETFPTITGILVGHPMPPKP